MGANNGSRVVSVRDRDAACLPILHGHASWKRDLAIRCARTHPGNVELGEITESDAVRNERQLGSPTLQGLQPNDFSYFKQASEEFEEPDASRAENLSRKTSLMPSRRDLH